MTGTTDLWSERGYFSDGSGGSGCNSVVVGLLTSVHFEWAD